MKKIFSLVFLSAGICTFSQQIESVETLLNDKISIRALELYDHKVWYSGTDSKFGFVDIKDTKNQKQITLSPDKLQFRTLGQDKTDFYTINIESPARFFKISKKDLTSEIVYTDTAKTAFYDALHFVNDKLAYTFSDADKDNILKLAVYKDGKWGMLKNDVVLNPGEAAFAASNTNISSSRNYMWIATGGKASRILRLDFKNEKFEIFTTPFVQGESSQGMYSIDFYNDQFGVAVGGDYTKQDANIDNIATTYDGGKTWQIQASGQNAGYTTCVKIKPGSKGKEMIALGDRHISYSSDFGKTWKKISDEKGLFVGQWVDGNRVVAAGNNRIVLLKLKF
ncbi:glycosyl hydrolase [Chryseobacterium indologenes]|uniref:WD40/YVTN/BNR-like repeat-containing protein n=1 Tax=Chryseobacterium indologenes TaxID=253 RepID=UPI0003E07EE0|nr:glycosyl hydrolase [Chryseobacterium indologenes]ATN04695.1 glycosyl hydrolase [Chryseobacterium indologenes]AYY86553.1 glycosyl hydrolase [Chryseobacterium indologenes]QIX83449.1 glycosyl hydrolase [Chryseobacterium indologenes]QPQ50831.1 glycosyl hydrolase [Chryseobacterium indologenes]TLX24874.1 glycosyl hydrolase [Chryseobacterium indologenes]